MSRISARFAVVSSKKCVAAVLVLLQIGFGLPAHASSAVRLVKPKTRQSPLLKGVSQKLIAAQMTLRGLQTRTMLATNAALEPLHAPSEFARLAAQFEEPLIATAPTSAREDKALLTTLEQFRDRVNEDDLSSLTSFVKEHPQSAWRVALFTDIGLLDYHYGYFQRAIDAYGEAWREGRTATDPKTKALVDRAVGELARMHARLGHADALEALFKDIGDRQISGPATEAITGAREGLVVMHTDPGIAYLCGPMALKNLLLSEHAPRKDVEFLDAVRSGPHGVTLQQVSELATKAKLRHTVIFRVPGQPVPVPSIIHWKVSHFAAIVGQTEGRFHVIDPTFGTDLWITKSAIDAESDGYFLVPSENTTFAWRRAPSLEIARVRGMGYPGTVDDGSTCDCDVSAEDDNSDGNDGSGDEDDSGPPLARYRFTEMVTSLHITDTPVGYRPPKGPSMKIKLNYNQREADQPSNFSFFNISQKWTLSVLSYIQDDPRSAGGSVSRYVAGGGDISYLGYNGTTGAFTPETRDASVLSRTTSGAIVYKRSLADGSVETYAASNGATTYPRLVFMTQLTDPSGNSMTLSYDNQQRLTAITDATGRLTTFSYGLSAKPLLVTQITDPFGRSAQITYDTSGRLSQITDILGLTSKFTYDSSSLINAMTTPYGTTTFTYGANGTYRYLSATDPLNHTERLEWYQPAPASSNLPFSEPSSLVPVGIVNPFNEYITGRDTFYWNKHAYAVGAGDYTKARVRHWMHNENNTNQMYHSMESYKYPLENRVWYNYPSQSSTGFSGSLDLHSRIGRVMDDGTTQLTKVTYNTQGHVTDMIDPVGREAQFIYATNGVDLIMIKQKTSSAGYSTVAQFTYNSAHLPLTYTDASGQTTVFTYNSSGQLLTMTDALGETATYQYDGLGYLISITNPNGLTQASFTYDTYSRVASSSDSEGYAVKYNYDSADRVTQQIFPDSTTQNYTWTTLDLTAITDRQNNTTQYKYDGVRNLVSTTDPLSHVVNLSYWENKTLKNFTDANGNTTAWNIDVQNRVTGKQDADGTQVTNTYESTTSRVKSIVDALKQVKTFAYNLDDTVKMIAYTNSVNPTPNVTFSYDSYFRRIVSMTDGNGTRDYIYSPTGSLGALQLAKETGPYMNDSLTYTYDKLSRLSSRVIDTSMETFAYDSLSRLTQHTTALGTFNLSYLGQTGQLAGQNISTGLVGTNWTYDTNINDRRLLSIANSGATRSFNYTTTPANLITQVQEVAPSSAAYTAKTWNYIHDSDYRLLSASSNTSTYSYGLDDSGNVLSTQTPTSSVSTTYNSVNELVSRGSMSYLYDKNGNLLDDGVHTFAWDAENRLITIGSKVSRTQGTTLTYDGFGRRAVVTTTNGGVSTANRLLWCGEALCQERTGADVVQRRYYSEGEYLPGGDTRLYYSQDQLGSVRDVLATQNGSRVASFDYDPYGSPSQSSGRIATDFRYSGLYYDQSDGLYLATHRVYNPSTGTWLSRDPIGLFGGLNKYEYADDDPSINTDIGGLDCCLNTKLSSDQILAVQTVLGENSWYLLGHTAYQPGDKPGHPSGASITSTTVYLEDLFMFSVFINRTDAIGFPDTIGAVATQPNQFIGYNSGSSGGITKYRQALSSAPGSSLCNDLLEAVSSLEYVQQNGSLLPPTYLYWKAINQGSTFHKHKVGDIYVGNTAFGTVN